jgi:hypothetical protein
MEIQGFLGNNDHLKLNKTGFLCSRVIPAPIAIKCKEWATNQRDKGVCVISGFHSNTEQEVLKILLKGKQPIIIVSARRILEETDMEPEIKEAFDSGRILFISPFKNDVNWVNANTAEIRNQVVIDLADNMTFGYVSKGGILERLTSKITDKPINRLYVKSSNNKRSSNFSKWLQNIVIRCNKKS